MHIFTFPADKIKGALIFAAKQDIRHYLNGILFEPMNGGMVAVATDGHRLVAIHAKQDGGFPDHFGMRPVIVNREDLAQALKAHTTRQVDIAFQVEDQVGDAPRVVRILCNGGAVKFETAEVEPGGRTLDWQRIIPRADREVSGDVCGFNAEYLADYAKLSKALGMKWHGVIIRGGGEHSARICIGHADVLSVIMPMRMGEAVEAEWFYGKPEEMKKAA